MDAGSLLSAPHFPFIYFANAISLADGSSPFPTCLSKLQLSFKVSPRCHFPPEDFLDNFVLPPPMSFYCIHIFLNFIMKICTPTQSREHGTLYPTPIIIHHTASIIIKIWPHVLYLFSPFSLLIHFKANSRHHVVLLWIF